MKKTAILYYNLTKKTITSSILNMSLMWGPLPRLAPWWLSRQKASGITLRRPSRADLCRAGVDSKTWQSHSEEMVFAATSHDFHQFSMFSSWFQPLKVSESESSSRAFLMPSIISSSSRSPTTSSCYLYNSVTLLLIYLPLFYLYT